MMTGLVRALMGIHPATVELGLLLQYDHIILLFNWKTEIRYNDVSNLQFKLLTG